MIDLVVAGVPGSISNKHTPCWYEPEIIDPFTRFRYEPTALADGTVKYEFVQVYGEPYPLPLAHNAPFITSLLPWRADLNKWVMILSLEDVKRLEKSVGDVKKSPPVSEALKFLLSFKWHQPLDQVHGTYWHVTKEDGTYAACYVRQEVAVAIFSAISVFIWCEEVIPLCSYDAEPKSTEFLMGLLWKFFRAARWDSGNLKVASDHSLDFLLFPAYQSAEKELKAFSDICGKCALALKEKDQ